MGNSEFAVSGIGNMKKELARLQKEIRKRANAAIKEEATAILKRAKDEFVPIAEGTLKKDSGIDLDKDEMRAEIWFGRGEAKEYAVPVHENPSEHDPPTWKGKTITFHPGGRGQKYLEIPFREAADGMLERIGKKVFSD